MLRLRPLRPESPSASSLAERVQEFTPLQMGSVYLVLHVLFSGLHPLVVTPFGVSAGVVVPAWLALVVFLAYFRQEEPDEVFMLAGVLAAIGVQLSLILRMLSSDFSQPERSSLLFGFFVLPVVLGFAAGFNAAVGVAIMRWLQRYLE